MTKDIKDVQELQSLLASNHRGIAKQQLYPIGQIANVREFIANDIQALITKGHALAEQNGLTAEEFQELAARSNSLTQFFDDEETDGILSFFLTYAVYAMECEA